MAWILNARMCGWQANTWCITGELEQDWAWSLRTDTIAAVERCAYWDKTPRNIKDYVILTLVFSAVGITTLMDDNPSNMQQDRLEARGWGRYRFHGKIRRKLCADDDTELYSVSDFIKQIGWNTFARRAVWRRVRIEGVVPAPRI